MIDQTPGQGPEEYNEEEREQPTQEESPLIKETFSHRHPEEPAGTPTDAMTPPDGERRLEWMIARARQTRQGADQSKAPEVDYTLIERYVAGQLDEQTERYVLGMNLRYDNWSAAYRQALRRRTLEKH